MNERTMIWGNAMGMELLDIYTYFSYTAIYTSYCIYELNGYDCTHTLVAEGWGQLNFVQDNPHSGMRLKVVLSFIHFKYYLFAYITVR